MSAWDWIAIVTATLAGIISVGVVFVTKNTAKKLTEKSRGQKTLPESKPPVLRPDSVDQDVLDIAAAWDIPAHMLGNPGDYLNREDYDNAKEEEFRLYHKLISNKMEVKLFIEHVCPLCEHYLDVHTWEPTETGGVPCTSCPDGVCTTKTISNSLWASGGS